MHELHIPFNTLFVLVHINNGHVGITHMISKVAVKQVVSLSELSTFQSTVLLEQGQLLIIVRWHHDRGLARSMKRMSWTIIICIMAFNLFTKAKSN